MSPRDADWAVAVEGLQVVLGGRTVLDIPRLAFAARGITVVLGPNGAGKTVLLHGLKGLLVPSAGRVRIACERGLRDVALVFQRPVLLRRTVRANLAYVLRRVGLPRRALAGRIQSLLRLCDLERLADRPARRLSGGEQQRLALAMALAQRPKLLLLDEPTASLDPAASAQVEALIRAAARDDTAVVLVTHDIAQARRLAQQVVFLHQGRVAEEAPAPEFFAGPKSPPARAYLQGELPL